MGTAARRAIPAITTNSPASSRSIGLFYDHQELERVRITAKGLQYLEQLERRPWRPRSAPARLPDPGRTEGHMSRSNGIGAKAEYEMAFCLIKSLSTAHCALEWIGPSDSNPIAIASRVRIERAMTEISLVIASCSDETKRLVDLACVGVLSATPYARILDRRGT